MIPFVNMILSWEKAIEIRDQKLLARRPGLLDEVTSFPRPNSAPKTRKSIPDRSYQRPACDCSDAGCD